MRTSEVRVFDDIDLELIDILRNLNLSRNVASTLVFLSNVDEATSIVLEVGSQLRQPEVSIAIKELKNLGWVDEREITKVGRGRPMKVYKLVVSMGEIIEHLEKQTKENTQCMVKTIEKLKMLKFKK
ncbi:MAG: ArsR family transcriptional regulator [Methanosarcinales archaeon]|nr:ArsR family transcriptional regulator [Methanosarcinales archaeon]